MNGNRDMRIFWMQSGVELVCPTTVDPAGLEIELRVHGMVFWLEQHTLGDASMKDFVHGTRFVLPNSLMRLCCIEM